MSQFLIDGDALMTTALKIKCNTNIIFKSCPPCDGHTTTSFNYTQMEVSTTDNKCYLFCLSLFQYENSYAKSYNGCITRISYIHLTTQLLDTQHLERSNEKKSYKAKSTSIEKESWHISNHDITNNVEKSENAMAEDHSNNIQQEESTRPS